MIDSVKQVGDLIERIGFANSLSACLLVIVAYGLKWFFKHLSEKDQLHAKERDRFYKDAEKKERLALERSEKINQALTEMVVIMRERKE